MSFTVKDFWSYTDDDSTLKDLVLLVAKPGGGGFSLINMTKEEFFNIANTMQLKFNPVSNDDLIIFNDAASVKARYLLASNYLYLDNLPRLLFSDDGSTNSQFDIRNEASEVVLVIGGNSPTNGDKPGKIRMLVNGGTEFATIDCTVTEELNVSLPDAAAASGVGGLDVDVAYRQDELFKYVTLLNTATTTLGSALRQTIIGSSASIASHTFAMPDPVNGNRARVAVNGEITSVTMTTPGAETVEEPFTSTSSGFQAREWLYVESETEWKRIA